MADALRCQTCPWLLGAAPFRQPRERPVDFAFTEDQRNIREAVLKHCAQFGGDYWLEHDRSGEWPTDFHQSMADAGWLGIAMPEAVGGSGLGITEAAVMMQAVAESGGGMVMRRNITSNAICARC
jgi:acyl-CoA dehydrogenase